MHHNTNWPFLLFIIVFGLLRWLASAAAKSKKEDTATKPRSSAPVPPPLPKAQQGDADAERVRKFLEALGQPADRPPPPPVIQRTDIPPRPVAPVQPPRVFVPTVPKPVKKAAGEVAERTRRVLQPVGQAAAESTAKRQEQVQMRAEISTEAPGAVLASQLSQSYRLPSDAPSTSEFATNIHSWLKSPVNLRKVVILREVLGRPRGLQPLDFEVSGSA